MSKRWTGWATGVATVALLVPVPPIATAQDADGFDGHIQSGTCAEPTDDLRVELDGDGDYDVEPYVARTGTDDETVVLGFYGSPGAPGFGFSAIYTEQVFWLVVKDPGTDEPVACGDILRPDADEFGEAGLAVVQLLPVGDSAVQGVAAIDRGPLQRELVVTPTRVRVLLSTGGDVITSQPVSGYDGYVQNGTCDSPGDRLRLQLKGGGDHDVEPFLAMPNGGAEPVTVAYYGAPLVPGFGLASAHTDQPFSLVITDTDAAEPVACGDILKPYDGDFADAGLAVVQLLPVGDPGAQGFALIERIALQRELDVTPTRVRIVVFAPPAIRQ